MEWAFEHQTEPVWQ